MARSSSAYLLLASAFIFPTAVFAASSGPVTPGKCVVGQKSHLEKALELKFEDDLYASGLEDAKVKVKLKEIKQENQQYGVSVWAAFPETDLIVSQDCSGNPSPCTTAPTITATENSTALLESCSVSYTFEAKYKYKLPVNPAAAGGGSGKLHGKASGTVAIPGIVAPAKR